DTTSTDHQSRQGRGGGFDSASSPPLWLVGPGRTRGEIMYRLRSIVMAALLLSVVGVPRAEGGVDVPCCGDCNGDGTVAITALISLVNNALASLTIEACEHGACDSLIDITDLIRAVNTALTGCPNTPVPTVTATALPTGTAAA